MAKGRILWFNRDKGYGFIGYLEDRDGRQDVFFHHTALKLEKKRRLKAKQLVEFQFRKTTLGIEATEVKLL